MASPFSPTTGRLILQHPLTPQTDDRGHEHPCPQAHVDLDNIGDELPGRSTAVGSWLNVVGYVEHKRWPQYMAVSKEILTPSAAHSAHVQAVMVWIAGSLDIGAYENVVRARQDSGKRMELGN